MKKLLEKDKILRSKIKNIEKQQLILESIFKNFNFFILIRWKAFLKLKSFSKTTSKVALSPRCSISFNKKRHNKYTNVSRHIFLKLIRTGYISGIQKSSW